MRRQVDKCAAAGVPAKEAGYDGQGCALEHHVGLLRAGRLLTSVDKCFLLVSCARVVGFEFNFRLRRLLDIDLYN